jgi:hypothetical protein
MNPNTPEEKRKRNFYIHWGDIIIGDSSPDYRELDPDWECPFDCLCYEITVKDLAKHNPRRYEELLNHLISQTGFNEAVFIAHGRKVRNILSNIYGRLSIQGQIQEGHKVRIKFPIVPLDLNP